MASQSFNMKRFTRWMAVLFAGYASVIVAPSWDAGEIPYGSAVAIGVAIATIGVVLFRAIIGYCLWCNKDGNNTLVNITRFGVVYSLFLFTMATGIPTTMKLAGLTMPLKGICATIFIATPVHLVVMAVLMASFPIYHLCKHGGRNAVYKPEPASAV